MGAQQAMEVEETLALISQVRRSVKAHRRNRALSRAERVMLMEEERRRLQLALEVLEMEETHILDLDEEAGEGEAQGQGQGQGQGGDANQATSLGEGGTDPSSESQQPKPLHPSPFHPLGGNAAFLAELHAKKSTLRQATDSHTHSNDKERGGAGAGAGADGQGEGSEKQGAGSRRDSSTLVRWPSCMHRCLHNIA